jgi:phosphoglycolate phosphatase
VTPEWLVLCDLDGTLLPVGPEGREALVAAFAALTGRRADASDVPIGKTADAEAFGLYAERLGLPRGAWRAPAWQAAYADHLAKALEARAIVPLPGAVALVRALGAQGRRGVLALVTGNLQVGARVKLRHLGLEGAFAVVATGDLALPRAELVLRAWRLAEACCGAAVAASRVVLLGDAPADVAAARALGVRSVAVGTGPAGPRVAASRPDLYVPSLHDTDRLLAWILARA